nr:ubiquitin-like protein Pup [Arthrobacter sp. JCM 19049]
MRPQFHKQNGCPVSGPPTRRRHQPPRRRSKHEPGKHFPTQQPPGTGTAGRAGPDPHPGTEAGVDDLLDEIDSVLETNAEEFVRGFVQKGGQ